MFHTLWEIAQLLEGKRFSELTKFERKVFDLLCEDWKCSRNCQWVWLSKDHPGYDPKKHHPDVIYAAE